MRLLRLIGAGLVAVIAVMAVFFTAALVFFAGLAAYVMQLIRRPPGPARGGPTHQPSQRPTRRTDEVIDVVTTKVGDEVAKH